jgi:hypothetical protein
MIIATSAIAATPNDSANFARIDSCASAGGQFLTRGARPGAGGSLAGGAVNSIGLGDSRSDTEVRLVHPITTAGREAVTIRAMPNPDYVIVGAGSAGCVLAARLSGRIKTPASVAV